MFIQKRLELSVQTQTGYDERVSMSVLKPGVSFALVPQGQSPVAHEVPL